MNMPHEAVQLADAVDYGWGDPFATRVSNQLRKLVEINETLLTTLISAKKSIEIVRTDAGHCVKGNILACDTNQYLVDVIDAAINKAQEKV
jgi:hypothetical protein